MWATSNQTNNINCIYDGHQCFEMPLAENQLKSRWGRVYLALFGVLVTHSHVDTHCPNQQNYAIVAPIIQSVLSDTIWQCLSPMIRDHCVINFGFVTLIAHCQWDRQEDRKLFYNPHTCDIRAVMENMYI